jgi:hypothetical protein
MGLNIDAARFLLAEKARGICFGKTLTLGRQQLYMSRKDYEVILDLVGGTVENSTYANDFLNAIGANPLESMDFSDYEGAEILHDANQPIPQELHHCYNTVIDGGTLEHVFNFPVAIRNCMELVRLGGQIMMFTPWHNYSGHGFYEFSPELLWKVFSHENGFEIERMLLVADGFWYEVNNPSKIKQRIEIRTNSEVLLFVTARKVSNAPIFQKWPQQSDYETAWQAGKYSSSSQPVALGIKDHLIKWIPFLETLQNLRRQLRRFRSLRPANNQGMQKLCPSHEIPFKENSIKR